jgi:hypothetical protein
MANNFTRMFRDHLSHWYLIFKILNRNNLHFIDEIDFYFSFQNDFKYHQKTKLEKTIKSENESIFVSILNETVQL